MSETFKRAHDAIFALTSASDAEMLSRAAMARAQGLRWGVIAAADDINGHQKYSAARHPWSLDIAGEATSLDTPEWRSEQIWQGAIELKAQQPTRSFHACVRESERAFTTLLERQCAAAPTGQGA